MGLGLGLVHFVETGGAGLRLGLGLGLVGYQVIKNQIIEEI